MEEILLDSSEISYNSIYYTSVLKISMVLSTSSVLQATISCSANVECSCSASYTVHTLRIIMFFHVLKKITKIHIFLFFLNNGKGFMLEP